MLAKFNHITRYFGFVTVVGEWFGFILMMVIRHPNLSEPASQYGYYQSTHYLFAAVFTAFALTYYLFSRHLNVYWRYTSWLSFLAGICFTITGWIPYQPFARSFMLDLHNIAISFAIILYAFPMLFISYSKKHENISLWSARLFWLVFVSALGSLLARFFDIGVIYWQLSTVVLFQVWIVIVNILLIKHHRASSSL